MRIDSRFYGAWIILALLSILPCQGQTPVRINSGGGLLTDSAGNQWIADKYFTGGTVRAVTSTIALSNGLNVYQTQRTAKSVVYDIPMANAAYAVALHFAEIVQGTVIGARQMDVYLNGTRVLQKLDVVQAAGGTFRALVTQHAVTVPNGTLSIRIDGVIGDAILSGVAITPVTTSITVSAISPAAVVVGPGGQQTFAASVSNTTNRTLLWSISPTIGSISSAGVYTAPPSLAADSTLTVKAASAADPSKSASASLTLKRTTGFNVSITPTSPVLGSDETLQFSATVTGAINKAVVWSATAGTISSTGLYKAPSGITAATSAQIRAVSLADATRSASTTVSLRPPRVTVTPSSATLAPSGKQQFAATVEYAANKTVVWSISPAVGTISAAGLYTAPATLTSNQTVTVRVTSAIDPTRYASAPVYLKASGDVTPPSVSFVAPLAGTANRGTVAVQVSAADNVGVKSVQLLLNGAVLATLSSPYSYAWDTKKAPNGSNTLRAVAADAAGNRAQADVIVNVDNPVSPITMPIEVLGPVGTTKQITVDVPSPVSTTDSYRMQLRIHGLDYDNKVAVQVNDGVWTILNNTTAILPTLERAYGGIGGGYHTLRPSFRLPLAALKAGPNKIVFRLETSNGVSSGYRVLAVNFLRPDNSLMVPEERFADEDPDTWLPPSTASADILEGERLWRQATLTSPGFPNGMKARCSDCHAQDGRDLKYFNYSNSSIRARSVFHGLTAAQGDQIASYIRSLNVPNPGRPWNPPYQPGPGLDSKPVSEWSAGAGLDWVLEKDSDMFQYLAPGGSTDGWAPAANLSARETPIALQLPDWNRWLPRVHPKDAWTDFEGSAFATSNDRFRSGMKPNDPVAYSNQKGYLNRVISDWFNFIVPKTRNQPPEVWTPSYVQKVYATALWEVVKLWELNQEFGLEAMSKAVFGPQADDRAWYSGFPFAVSPNMLNIPRSAAGIGVGTVASNIYTAYIWYHTQLLLNNSNRREYSAANPMDVPYVFGFVKDMSAYASRPQAGIWLLWNVKLQQVQHNGIGPERGSAGWHARVNNAAYLVNPSWQSVWADTTAETRCAYSEVLFRNWFVEASSFTPAAYYQGNWAKPDVNPVARRPDGSMGDMIWFAIPQWKFLGITPSAADRVADWAKTIWPNANWDATKLASCSGSGDQIYCGTDFVTSTALTTQ